MARCRRAGRALGSPRFFQNACGRESTAFYPAQQYKRVSDSAVTGARNAIHRPGQFRDHGSCCWLGERRRLCIAAARSRGPLVQLDRLLSRRQRRLQRSQGPKHLSGPHFSRLWGRIFPDRSGRNNWRRSSRRQLAGFQLGSGLGDGFPRHGTEGFSLPLRLRHKHCWRGASYVAAHNISESLSWLGTTRGRVGVAAGRTLYYATGGVAYGRIGTNITEADTLVGPGTATANTATTRTGWVAGGGLEAALTGNWTAKIEYLFLPPRPVLGAQQFAAGTPESPR
jgi:hypothetical protein